MIRISEYLYTPRDVGMLVRRMRVRDWIGVCTVTLAVSVPLFFLKWGGESGFFWGYTAVQFWWRRSSRASFVCALVFLVAIPVFLGAHQANLFFLGEMWAERIAVWAYYFLLIGTLLEIFHMMRNKSE